MDPLLSGASGQLKCGTLRMSPLTEVRCMRREGFTFKLSLAVMNGPTNY